MKHERPDNTYAESPDDPRFPYILTTYRLTEHHTAGGMSRGLSHLAELQPELFAEISPELANEIGIAQNEWVTLVTPRGIVSAKAMVTTRMRPFLVDGRVIDQVGLPYHWGWKGLVTGDVETICWPFPRSRTCASWRRRDWSATWCAADEPTAKRP